MVNSSEQDFYSCIDVRVVDFRTRNTGCILFLHLLTPKLHEKSEFTNNCTEGGAAGRHECDFSTTLSPLTSAMAAWGMSKLPRLWLNNTDA